MTIADIKSRKEILDAIAEFDRLGRDHFLEKYGFGPSRSYWLLHQGKHYDSKAVIGAARGYARPDLGPMTADEFSGGEATVRRKLEELGFAVEVIASDHLNAAKPTQSSDAFLLTWKESGWPHSNILRMLKTFEAQGFVEEPWRIRAQHVRRGGRSSPWLTELLKRKSPKLAAVALANKMARIAWKLMVTGEHYAAKSTPAASAGVA